MALQVILVLAGCLCLLYLLIIAAEEHGMPQLVLKTVKIPGKSFTKLSLVVIKM